MQRCPRAVRPVVRRRRPQGTVADPLVQAELAQPCPAPAAALTAAASDTTLCVVWPHLAAAVGPARFPTHWTPAAVAALGAATPPGLAQRSAWLASAQGPPPDGEHGVHAGGQERPAASLAVDSETFARRVATAAPAQWIAIFGAAATAGLDAAAWDDAAFALLAHPSFADPQRRHAAHAAVLAMLRSRCAGPGVVFPNAAWLRKARHAYERLGAPLGFVDAVAACVAPAAPGASPLQPLMALPAAAAARRTAGLPPDVLELCVAAAGKRLAAAECGFTPRWQRAVDALLLALLPRPPSEWAAGVRYATNVAVFGAAAGDEPAALLDIASALAVAAAHTGTGAQLPAAFRALTRLALKAVAGRLRLTRYAAGSIAGCCDALLLCAALIAAPAAPTAAADLPLHDALRSVRRQLTAALPQHPAARSAEAADFVARAVTDLLEAAAGEQRQAPLDGSGPGTASARNARAAAVALLRWAVQCGVRQPLAYPAVLDAVLGLSGAAEAVAAAAVASADVAGVLVDPAVVTLPAAPWRCGCGAQCSALATHCRACTGAGPPRVRCPVCTKVTAADNVRGQCQWCAALLPAAAALTKAGVALVSPKAAPAPVLTTVTGWAADCPCCGASVDRRHAVCRGCGTPSFATDTEEGRQRLRTTLRVWRCGAAVNTAELRPGDDPTWAGPPCAECLPAGRLHLPADLGPAELQHYRQWRCGCGALNAPGSAACWSCTDRVPAFTCPRCDRHALLEHAPPRDRAHRTTPPFPTRECPGCHAAHPRDAVLAAAALSVCSACGAGYPRDLPRCPRCEEPAACAHVPDLPWRCLGCGTANDVHLSALSCAGCGADRPHPGLYDEWRAWRCKPCGALTRGPACGRCGDLHPALPRDSVVVWRCNARGCGAVSPSWVARCTGCDEPRGGGLVHRYAAWRCACGEANSPLRLRRCWKCQAPRPEPSCGACGRRHLEAECPGRSERHSLTEAALLRAASAALVAPGSEHPPLCPPPLDLGGAPALDGADAPYRLPPLIL